ncbi:MAG: hypothetical protein Q7U20_06465 [Caulobacter sp.]|nr:hypothetical protein [Caulobacter sp.]
MLRLLIILIASTLAAALNYSRSMVACTGINDAGPKFTPGNLKFTTGISGPMAVSKTCRG